MAAILWVFAGPNGAGKTTLFNDMLRGQTPYINADEIVGELDPASGGVDVIRAGRLAIERRNAMVARGESLSIETTLSGNSALAFMRKAKAAGFRISLAYVGIDTPELSRARALMNALPRAVMTFRRMPSCAGTPTRFAGSGPRCGWRTARSCSTIAASSVASSCTWKMAL